MKKIMHTEIEKLLKIVIAD